MSENFELSLVKDYKKKLTYIFMFQTILFVSSILILVFVNIHQGIFGNLSIPVINSSLFGFIGSLVYFSRKSYVYLITQKL